MLSTPHDTYILSHEREFSESVVRKKFEHAIRDAAGRELCLRVACGTEIMFGSILYRAVETLKSNYGFSDARITQVHYMGQRA